MLKKKLPFHFVVFIFNAAVVFFLSGCGGLFSSSDLREEALANQRMQIEQRVYHNSPDSSLLLFKVNTSDLLYARANRDNGFTARLLVELKIIDAKNGSSIYMDSLVYEDVQQFKDEDLLVGRISFPFSRGQKSEIRTRYTDLNKRQEVVLQGFTSKLDENLNDAILLITPNGLPLISKVNQMVGSFTILGNTGKQAKLFYCKDDFNLPAPPFVDINTLNSVKFEIKALGDSLNLDENNGGFYKISNAANSGEAFTFLHRPNGYPKSADFRELLEAARYFQSSDELKLYLDNPNERLAFESFWLKLSGNKEKAKRNIKAYYDRLVDANKFFTQYTDGWRTDRGMVYMVLGPPSRVFYQDQNEIWIYGRDNNVNNVSFNFERKVSSEIGVFYELNRSSSYRQLWSIAAGTWRSGRIFNF